MELGEQVANQPARHNPVTLLSHVDPIPTHIPMSIPTNRNSTGPTHSPRVEILYINLRTMMLCEMEEELVCLVVIGVYNDCIRLFLDHPVNPVLKLPIVVLCKLV
ncbi:E3 ubiquitin-protein ligase TRIM62 [Striga asiatica]|uniref:E3 ubiquitin-protein ligase TRIM62 n=1 Tax=Striga asiatica TaxID=4170 RepID=A0A5A7PIW8_STRAF|nr:E3 ubiquitin-protein ligase TRIM62 [Striga asiatica]